MSFTVEKNLECRLEDGVILRADVYRPEMDGKYPVLLCRTPYDKSSPTYVGMAERLAQNGYIAVIQDIRGRYASDGDWVFQLTRGALESEAADGYIVCEWAARLPGSDGQVGTWGNSYASWLIWAMASSNPPSLKAVFASGQAPRVLEYTNGILETGLRLRYWHRMAVSSRLRNGLDEYPRTHQEANHRWELLRGKWLWHIPLETIPDHLFGPDAEQNKKLLKEVHQDFFEIDKYYAKIAVPTMSLTGWWDRISYSSFNYTGMRRDGPEETRDQHRLIIGPWLHSVEARGDWVGPRDYGVGSRLDLVTEIVRWNDLHLKGIDNGLREEKPVRLWLLNDTDYSYWSDWPPREGVTTPFYLHSNGAANTPNGDGALSTIPPAADEPADTYVYDPADPVLSLADEDLQIAPCDQAPLASRDDILVYQTSPLTEDLVLAGRLSCTLWVSCDTPDTDFVARLVEVGADGLAINISHGILRCRYREGFDREVPLVPNEPTEITISMLPVGIRLKAGSRLRLDVTSSDFPLFDRNHNTGRPYYSDEELRVARPKVFHDAAHPSRLIASVVPNA